MPSNVTLHPDVVAAERLGDEIAELSAHIEVAMAWLLSLIREFDALCARCRRCSSSVQPSPGARSPTPRCGP